MPIQHPRLRSAGKMSYIHITEENIDKEHICCAMSGKQSLAKKEWLKQRFNEGLVFYRSEERGKCFIEYIPAENAWVPIDADGWIYINCLWVAGSLKGHGHSGNLLSECIRDAKEQGRKGICILSAEGRKREFLADPRFLSYKGFEVTDISDCGINLMALPFEENAELPKFKECAKHPAVDEDGFVLYYTDQCPFTCYWVPRVRQTAEEHNIPFKTIHITDKRPPNVRPRRSPRMRCLGTANSSPKASSPTKSFWHWPACNVLNLPPTGEPSRQEGSWRTDCSSGWVFWGLGRRAIL